MDCNAGENLSIAAALIRPGPASGLMHINMLPGNCGKLNAGRQI
jgi:hypothetical protein